jgi:ubiquinone/menaquinone biosynthesis C-methylase UbiE
MKSFGRFGGGLGGKSGEQRSGSSDPHAEQAAFRPGLKERWARASGLYALMHGLHFVRQHEFRHLLRCLAPGGALLDIACGDGYFTRRFSEALDCRARGVDLMPTRIARAHFYNTTARCTFVQADATSLPFEDASFEQAVSVGSLEHFDHPTEALREAHRVLVPGGRLALTCDAFWNAGFSEAELAEHAARHYVHELFDPSSLRQLLEGAGFAVRRIEPLFRSRPAIWLFRGAARLGFDWSSPAYNAFSLVAGPLVSVAEGVSRASPPRGVFLLADCVRPG